jgi:hypothetical protein
MQPGSTVQWISAVLARTIEPQRGRMFGGVVGNDLPEQRTAGTETSPISFGAKPTHLVQLNPVEERKGRSPVAAEAPDDHRRGG